MGRFSPALLAAVLVVFVGYLPSTTAGKDSNIKHTDNYAGAGCGEVGYGVGGGGRGRGGSDYGGRQTGKTRVIIYGGGVPVLKVEL